MPPSCTHPATSASRMSPSRRSRSRPTRSSGSSATCVCGSDLWPYRGLQPLDGPMHMGHEYCGVVVEVGSRREDREARPVRRRLLLHLRQHLSALPPRLPVLLRAARVHVRRAGASRARAAGRRHAGRDGDDAGRGPDPEPAGGLGRARHRLVRGGRRPGAAGIDRRRRGRRRRRVDGRPRGEADGRGAHHRHEPPQDPTGSGAGIRRDRHRLRARRRRRGADQGADADESAPTPCSNASAPRNR